MTNSITNRQMAFILFLSLTTYTTIDLPNKMAQTAGRSSWIPIMLASVLFGIAVVIITKLNNMFKGKVMFDYSQDIVGKFFAYLISLYFLLYFLIIAVFLKVKLVTMLTSNFLPKTPQFIMLFFAILLSGYAAYKGITNIARAFEITGVIFLIITLGICIFMLSEGMYFNIAPFFNASDTKFFMEAMKDLIVPFGGADILLIIPFTAKNKKAPKAAFLTLFFIGLFYVLIVEGTFMILGINNTIALKNDSFIEAVKVVEMPVIERTDIFYLTTGLTSLFAGLIIAFTALTEFACRIFSKAKRHIVVIAAGVILFILSLFALNIKNIDKVYRSYVSYLILISGVLIPTLLFIAAKVKKRTHGKEKVFEK